ncbi:MAG: PEP/pyruvate-binding domain-containing protein [Victivallales bacterium]|nr:PEP/pyruvate-binding domain-containing protein [Victivallales bacterium]
MKYLIHIDGNGEVDKTAVGDKAYNLDLLKRSGAGIPDTVALTTAAYDRFLDSSGLDVFIGRELNRKRFSDYRWEELWDISLRIKNAFLRVEMPAEIDAVLNSLIPEHFGKRPLAVRSSAPGEDGRNASFAGLHESYINLIGAAEVIKHIRLVWASLWSVSALLYRRELKQEPGKSAMAVIIQELVCGEVSGVAFSSSPDNPECIAVEAVYGLNQGLVDGTVEPDHWNVNRNNLKIHSFFPAGERRKAISVIAGKTCLRELPRSKRLSPPLVPRQVRTIAGEASRQETFFGHPRDLEWTLKASELILLQSRPITAAVSPDDPRKYYSGLQLSFNRLREIRSQLENNIFPGMLAVAQTWNAQTPATMNNKELLDRAVERMHEYRRWLQAYGEYCIPFAHGTRLFGEIYNTAVKPEDPYEFVELLRTGKLLSLQRNRKLIGLAKRISSSGFPEKLRLNRRDAELLLKAFNVKANSVIPAEIREILKTLAACTARRQTPTRRKHLEENFFAAFSKNRRDYAHEVLDLARASYRLRDDDNIYLAGVKNGVDQVRTECRDRIAAGLFSPARNKQAVKIVQTALPELHSPAISKSDSASDDPNIKFRQLTGQPAGKGVARGPARVIHEFRKLLDFKAGEILVCDAVEPEMTVVAPLAAAVVERRGGMLIHGAIIAREYSLPCVTGVPEATRKIQTGDLIAVDGWLGIITILEQQKLKGNPYAGKR